jgi:putative peptidoglycan lipid II flippase
MLVFVPVLPTWRLRLRWRLTLKFPPGVLRRASGLAFVGVLEFVAADIASLVTIDLANGHGTTGALVLYNYSYLVFAAVTSVLPVAIVTATFPVLSATDGAEFDRTSAGSSRAIALMSWLATAAMIAVTLPAAHVLTQRHDQVAPLAQAFLLYAPGVAGLAIVTNMSRVLFALGKLKAAGIILVAQQLLPAALAFPLVLLTPPHLTTEMLALANSVGFTAVAIPAVLATRRLRGPDAVAGLGHATLAGIAACAAGGAVGLALTLVLPSGGNAFEAGAGLIALLAAVAVFGVVAYVLDPGDTRVALARLRRLARKRT